MDLYKIIIAPEAMEQLNEYVSYIKYELLNESAARGVYDDATETGSELTKVAESLQYCRNRLLRQYGYRVILFRYHQYLGGRKEKGRWLRIIPSSFSYTLFRVFSGIISILNLDK